MNNASMNIHPGISIALCTYNGERYLKEQLDSFLRQTLPPFELVACDDCSTDSTIRILEEFSCTAPFPVRIFRNEQNLGLIKNFSKAASLCQGEYLAFSDQEDIWLPDTLEACFQVMKNAEREFGKDIPLMVHTDLSLIDTQNRIIAPSCMKVRHVRNIDVDPLRNILVRNYISGCTSLCNRILIEKSLPFPDVIMNHDGWVALIAASCGRILFIQEPKVLYRQHSSNVTGSANYLYDLRALNPRFLLKHVVPWTIYMLVEIFYQARVLQKRLNDISCKVPTYLDDYIKALQEGGLVNAFRVMFSLKVRDQGFIPNILDFYIIARGRLLTYKTTRKHDYIF